VPTGNVDPDAGTQITGTAPSIRSSALALQLAIAPEGPVAASVISPGSDSEGGAKSANRSGRSRSVTAGGTMKVLALNPPPFRRAALDRSVIKLTGKTDKLDWTDTAYRKWKQALSEGKNVPLYDKSVAAVVNELEPKIVSSMKGAAKKQSQ